MTAVGILDGVVVDGFVINFQRKRVTLTLPWCQLTMRGTPSFLQETHHRSPEEGAAWRRRGQTGSAAEKWACFLVPLQFPDVAILFRSTAKTHYRTERHSSATGPRCQWTVKRSTLHSRVRCYAPSVIAERPQFFTQELLPSMLLVGGDFNCFRNPAGHAGSGELKAHRAEGAEVFVLYFRQLQTAHALPLTLPQDSTTAVPYCAATTVEARRQVSLRCILSRKRPRRSCYRQWTCFSPQRLFCVHFYFSKNVYHVIGRVGSEVCPIFPWDYILGQFW